MPTNTPLNILFITCDELRADAVSVYGNPFTTMPAAERMAREGVTIENAFCQIPKCVPSRCSILTGRYPHVDGYRTLLGRKEFPQHPRVRDNSLLTLYEHVPNLVTLLRDKGYKTALLGKNHVVEWNLHEKWFDTVSRWQWRKPTFQSQSSELTRADFGGRLPADHPLSLLPDAVVAGEAIDFLEQVGEQPFFAMVDMQLPHPFYMEYPTPVLDVELDDIPDPPWVPIEEAPPLEQWLRRSKQLESLEPRDRKRIRRAYYSMAEFADQQVNRILDVLDRTGLASRTLVVYTSDHGDFAGDHNCYEKWDTAMLDCLVRVPLIFRYPNVLPAKQRRGSLAELVDIMPTILDLASYPIPGYVQGRSLLPLLKGLDTRHKEVVFAQGGVEKPLTRRAARPVDSSSPSVKQKVLLDFPDTMLRAKMVRTENYKLIYRLSGDHELYDLREDPHELSNLYFVDGLAGVREELIQHLLRYLIETETNQPEVEYLHA